MEESKGNAGDFVKEFLASSGSEKSQRSAITFDQLTVQGSGAGVRAQPA